MFKVNGAAPMLDSTTYARLDQYILKENDVITFYYVDCPTDDGNHIPSASDPTVCSVCGGHIPAVTTTYVWNDNNSECTATATRNGVVTATETAKSTMTVVKAATCTEKGQVKFTVEFKNAAFSKQEKTIDTDPLNHDWYAPTYEWKEISGGYECTAKRVCKHDVSHVETDKATVTYAEITPATCLVNGEGRYTAKFGAAWAEAQTKDVVLTKLDHSHNGRWIYNREQHWQKCGHCGELTNVGAHTFTEWKDILRDGKVVSEHHCTVCGFSECAQIIHIDGTKKPQAGVEVNPATGAAVPAVLPAIAVLAGAAVLIGKKK